MRRVAHLMRRVAHLMRRVAHRSPSRFDRYRSHTCQQESMSPHPTGPNRSTPSEPITRTRFAGTTA